MKSLILNWISESSVYPDYLLLLCGGVYSCIDFCQVVSTFCFPLFYLGRPPPVQEVHGFLNTVINLVFSLHTSLSPFFNLSCCFPEHQINNVIPLLRSKKPTATSNNQPSKSKQNSATNYDHPWCLGNFLFTTGKCLNSLAYSLRILKSHTQSTLLNLPPTAFAIHAPFLPKLPLHFLPAFNSCLCLCCLHYGNYPSNFNPSFMAQLRFQI